MNKLVEIPMDEKIQKYLDALQMLCDGKADFVDAGNITFYLIFPGVIVIDLHRKLYLYFQEGILQEHNQVSSLV
jgi:hypothetical protein